MVDKELVDKALDKYSQRRKEVAEIRKTIESIIDENASDAFIRQEESLKNKGDINNLRDIRSNTLRDSKLKGLVDKVKKDGVVTNAESLDVMINQKDLRLSLAKSINASIRDEKEARLKFNLELAQIVDTYLKNLVKITKGLKPKSFLKALELRTLVSKLELDDVSEVDVNEDITAEDHPVQRILNLLKPI